MTMMDASLHSLAQLELLAEEHARRARHDKADVMQMTAMAIGGAMTKDGARAMRDVDAALRKDNR